MLEVLQQLGGPINMQPPPHLCSLAIHHLKYSIELASVVVFFFSNPVAVFKMWTLQRIFKCAFGLGAGNAHESSSEGTSLEKVNLPRVFDCFAEVD